MIGPRTPWDASHYGEVIALGIGIALGLALAAAGAYLLGWL